MVLSTFYADDASSRQSVVSDTMSLDGYGISQREDDSSTVSNTEDPPTLASRRVNSAEELSRDDLGVYIA